MGRRTGPGPRSRSGPREKVARTGLDRTVATLGPAADFLGANSLSSSDAFKFPKLTGSNFAEWEEPMKAALQARYLWLVVSGDETCPAKPAATLPKETTAAEWKAEKKEYLDWCQRDQAAMGLKKGAV